MSELRLVPALVLLMSLGAFGQDEEKTSREWQLISKSDKNADGKVTVEEYARGEVRFARLDKNKDGVLTSADFARSEGRRGGRRRRDPKAMRGQMLARLLGLRRDQSMTRQQFDAWVDARAKTEDGDIDLGAISDAVPARMTRFIARTFDGDGDGKVSPTELKGSFTDADKNSDGKIDRDELRGRRGAGRRDGARNAAKTPKVGEVAPDFDLPYKDGDKTAKLSSFAGKRPVALIFGSYT